MIRKVLAYIVRRNNDRDEILVFDHLDFPEAGQQVPSGTVEEGEEIQDALLREVREESGLENATIIASLGNYEFKNKYNAEWQRKHVFLLNCPENTPDEWIHNVRSTGEDNLLRFKFYWVELSEADLIYDQGDYLKHISL